jgi:hypothetical protein
MFYDFRRSREIRRWRANRRLWANFSQRKLSAAPVAHLAKKLASSGPWAAADGTSNAPAPGVGADCDWLGVCRNGRCEPRFIRRDGRIDQCRGWWRPAAVPHLIPGGGPPDVTKMVARNSPDCGTGARWNWRHGAKTDARARKLRESAAPATRTAMSVVSGLVERSTTQ